MNSAIETVFQEFGTRPFFIYDLDSLKIHFEQFQLPGIKFWYATKANPLSSIVKQANQAHFGIDCASSGEVRQALRSGVSPDQILLTGPCKSKTLFLECLKLGVEIYVLESLQQALDLDSCAKELGIYPKALLRIQLAWEHDEKSVLGGNKITPFGLPPLEWGKLKEHSFSQIQFLGVHCFQWGNILDLEKLFQIWIKTATVAKTLSEKLGFELKVLDVGGGLGIPYQGEAAIPYFSLAQKLQELKNTLPDTEIWMELGRYAVGPFGKYISKIIDIKQVYGKTILVLEGGVHHLVRPALVGEAFPAEVHVNQKKENSKTKSFEVHGPLCTALDHLGTFEFSSELKVGDAIVFHQCGAYGFTESMPYFLCHDLPAEFILEEGKVKCIRPWKGPESWLV